MDRIRPSDYEHKRFHLARESTGYLYFMDRNHPLAMSGGKVLYHRHLASIKIGRWLKRTEHVHHKNEDRTDNSLGNIEIMSNSEHTRYHNKEKMNPRLNSKCLRCDRIFTWVFRRNKRIRKFCSVGCRGRLHVPKNSLAKLIWLRPMVDIAREFGVSGKAIEKRCKKLGICRPPQGYWNSHPRVTQLV